MARPWKIPPLAVFFAAAAGLVAPGSGQESIADLESFRAGCQALVDERYETAAGHFRESWETLQSNGAGEAEENFVAARLLEAMAKGGDTAGAIEWLKDHPLLRPFPATSRWIAVALQKEERFAEAAESYNLYLSSNPGAGNVDLINRAICLARSGRAAAAFELVHEIVSPETAEDSLRLAQIAESAAEYDEAIDYLARIDPQEAESPSLRLPVARVKARVFIRSGRREAALDTAYRLVDGSPDAGSARLAFLLLGTLKGSASPGDLESRFDAWEESDDFPGREAARLFRIVFFSKPETRAADLENFLLSGADAELLAECRIRLAENAVAENAVAENAFSDFSDRESLPQELLARVKFSEVAGDYLAGSFASALKRFIDLADAGKGEDRVRNLYNASVSALQKGDTATFVACEEAIAKTNPRSPLLSELFYLGGLYYAANGDPEALDRLNAFVRESPEHPLNADAQLALAEIHLNQAPARSQAAREIFQSLATRPLTLSQSERLDYISIWVELTDNDLPAAVRRAEQFDLDWPSSTYLKEVLMILATKHFELKNREAAARYFRKIADRFPDSLSAETARFFEAMASPRGEETIAKWRQIVASGGSFVEEARHELALLFLAEERFEEAGEELKWLVENLPGDAELRFAAMADLGFATYVQALGDNHDPKRLEEAAGHFAALSNTASAPPFWRYNAAVRRGKCLEAIGKSTVALEIYRSIVDETGSSIPGSDADLSPKEAEWVFRAGFAAIDILAAKENWSGAIAVADTLSEKDGPRAIEAARLAERMRLKHWVWD